MSYVIAAPEMMTASASDLAGIGSSLDAAHAAAAARTVAISPAAADEVSESVAHLFSAHAQDYQALAGRALAFHDQFVQHLTATATTYASAEAVNTALLRPVTASAASIIGDIGSLPGRLLSLFGGAVNQLIVNNPAFYAIAADIFFGTFIFIPLTLILFSLLIFLPFFGTLQAIFHALAQFW
jgi:hypothetical protein